MAIQLCDDLIGIFKNESQKLKRVQETNKRPPHLRPFYYRILLTTRPFGLALCKTFDEKYLCVVLPESPSGQLGLRAGSEILSINSFAQKSELIKTLNDEYPNQKQHNFIWMYQFPKVQYLQDNAVMPITLYLKYDPFVVLAENTKKVLTDQHSKTETDSVQKEECTCWKLLQDDIYRWAVQQTYELWDVTVKCDIYSMPAIQSPVIEQNILNYYYSKDHKQTVQNKLNNKDDTAEIKSMDQFIVEDEYYKKIGEVEKGMRLRVYAKAGAYLEIREPIKGWVKFKKVGRSETIDYCAKNDGEIEEKMESKTGKGQLESIGRNKGDFTLFITQNYLSGLNGLRSIGNSDSESDSGDNEYNIMDVLGAMGSERMTVLYFMGDIDFGHTFDTQQKHLKQLMNLQTKFKNRVNFVVVRVCCVNNEIKSAKVAQRLCVGDKEVSEFVYGRARMEILKIYGLLTYDTGFFKYGLMLLDKEYKIVIHPKENMIVNDSNELGFFERVASCILSNMAHAILD